MSKAKKNTVIVSGATSLIGLPLLRLLKVEGLNVLPVSRQTINLDSADTLLNWDLSSALTEKDTSALNKALEVYSPSSSDESLSFIHCAPIWLLTKHIDSLAEMNVKRIIAFSSTSVEGKSGTDDAKEQEIVRLLTDSENQIQESTDKYGIHLTIFRPTMIYGYGQGQNIAFIASLINRFGFFPVVTKATGLRSPVHSDDLAKAALQSLFNKKTYGQAYNLSGGEVLSYKDMVVAIGRVLGKSERTFSLPMVLYKVLLTLVVNIASLFGKQLPASTAMADRMRQDLNFSSEKAKQDFAYAPQSFLPNGKSDIISE